MVALRNRLGTKPKPMDLFAFCNPRRLDDRSDRQQENYIHWWSIMPLWLDFARNNKVTMAILPLLRVYHGDNSEYDALRPHTGYRTQMVQEPIRTSKWNPCLCSLRGPGSFYAVAYLDV